MQKDEIIRRLKEALREARRPHYGCADTQIDYLFEALDMVEKLVSELENI